MENPELGVWNWKLGFDISPYGQMDESMTSVKL